MHSLASMMYQEETSIAINNNLSLVLDTFQDELELPQGRVRLRVKNASVVFDSVETWDTFMSYKPQLVSALADGNRDLHISFGDKHYTYVVRTSPHHAHFAYLYHQYLLGKIVTHFLVSLEGIEKIFNMDYDVKRHFRNALYHRETVRLGKISLHSMLVVDS